MAVIALAVAGFLFTGIPVFAVLATAIRRASIPATKKHHVRVVQPSHFKLDDVDAEIDVLLDLLWAYDDRLHRALLGALPFVTLVFHPGLYVVDDFGNKNNAHTLGRFVVLADKGGQNLAKTALLHELVHIALDAADLGFDEDHKRAIWKDLSL